MENKKPGKILTIKDVYDEDLTEYSTQLSNNTIPLFVNDYEKHLKMIGSAIYFEFKDRRFLISAAHVLLDNSHESIFIPDGEYFNNLTNGFVSGNIINENEKRSDDKLDLAIYEITDENIAKMKIFTPINLNDLDVHHNLDDSKYRPYIAVGYPATKTKMIKCDLHTKSKCYSYASNLSEETKYQELGVEKHSHILIDFNRKDAEKSDQSKITFPIPNGMSGGGLWYFPVRNLLSSEKPRPKLVGILTEYQEGKISSIIATRIHIVMEVLRLKYGISVPKTKITNVKIL